MDEAVAIALQRNRDVIAARLEIEGAELDVVAARVYPNPTLVVHVGNLVLGKGNPQRRRAAGRARASSASRCRPSASARSSTSGRSAARASRAAERGRRAAAPADRGRAARDRLRRALGVRRRRRASRPSASSRARWPRATPRRSACRRRASARATSPRPSCARSSSRACSYQNAVIDADMQLDLARRSWRRCMGLASARQLPGARRRSPTARPTFDARAPRRPTALERRPDLRAAGAARAVAEAAARRRRSREAYPDFDAGRELHAQRLHRLGRQPEHARRSACRCRCRSSIATRPASAARGSTSGAPTTTRERLRLAVEHDVAEAVRKAARAQALLRVFEGDVGAEARDAVPAPLATTATRDKGGMLERAEIALQVAEKSYKAGAISLLELLEAQRTYLDTRGAVPARALRLPSGRHRRDPRRGRGNP